MAALVYEAIIFEERLQTPVTIPLTFSVDTCEVNHIRGSTQSFDIVGSLFENSTWRPFSLTNLDRISASHINSYKQLVGVVQRTDGTGIPRKVIALSQVTHQVLGSTTSDVNGNFTLKLETSAEEEVRVIAIPDELDERNEVIFAKIVPTDPL